MLWAKAELKLRQSCRWLVQISKNPQIPGFSGVRYILANPKKQGPGWVRGTSWAQYQGPMRITHTSFRKTGSSTNLFYLRVPKHTLLARQNIMGRLNTARTSGALGVTPNSKLVFKDVFGPSR
jgi:hypothetical protein